MLELFFPSIPSKISLCSSISFSFFGESFHVRFAHLFDFFQNCFFLGEGSHLRLFGLVRPPSPTPEKSLVSFCNNHSTDWSTGLLNKMEYLFGLLWLNPNHFLTSILYGRQRKIIGSGLHQIFNNQKDAIQKMNEMHRLERDEFDVN